MMKAIYIYIICSDAAVSLLKTHDYYEAPLSLYLAFQATHVPWTDVDKYPNGMPNSYFDSSTLESFDSEVVGVNRQEYGKALKLLDGAVGKIYDALVEVDQINNTW